MFSSSVKTDGENLFATLFRSAPGLWPGGPGIAGAERTGGDGADRSGGAFGDLLETLAAGMPGGSGLLSPKGGAPDAVPGEEAERQETGANIGVEEPAGDDEEAVRFVSLVELLEMGGSGSEASGDAIASDGKIRDGGGGAETDEEPPAESGTEGAERIDRREVHLENESAAEPPPGATTPAEEIAATEGDPGSAGETALIDEGGEGEAGGTGRAAPADGTAEGESNLDVSAASPDAEERPTAEAENGSGGTGEEIRSAPPASGEQPTAGDRAESVDAHAARPGTEATEPAARREISAGPEPARREAAAAPSPEKPVTAAETDAATGGGETSADQADGEGDAPSSSGGEKSSDSRPAEGDDRGDSLRAVSETDRPRETGGAREREAMSLWTRSTAGEPKPFLGESGPAPHATVMSDTPTVDRPASAGAHLPSTYPEAWAARGSMLEQLGTEAKWLLRTGRNEAEIHLEPPELGRLTLKLTVTGKAVKGVIEVENPNVKAILHSEIHRLAAALTESGLELGQFDVLLAEEKEPGRGSAAPDREGRAGAAGDGLFGDEMQEEDEAPAITIAGGGTIVNYLM